MRLSDILDDQINSIKVLSEGKFLVSEGLRYHIDNKIPLVNNIYRTYSQAYFDLINEVRYLHARGLVLLSESDLEIIRLDIGKTGINENGVEVYLDMPVLEEFEYFLEVKERTPELNKPKRGGSKKFYVYVRKPDGGIKKVSFGDTTGLSVKINDPEARANFAKRHNCSEKTDKTTAGYWSCRLPRYAKLLGLKSNFNGYW